MDFSFSDLYIYTVICQDSREMLCYAPCLKEDGVGVAYDKYNEKLIPDSVRKKVAQLRLDIIAGKIVVPSTK